MVMTGSKPNLWLCSRVSHKCYWHHNSCRGGFGISPSSNHLCQLNDVGSLSLLKPSLSLTSKWKNQASSLKILTKAFPSLSEMIWYNNYRKGWRQLLNSLTKNGKLNLQLHTCCGGSFFSGFFDTQKRQWAPFQQVSNKWNNICLNSLSLSNKMTRLCLLETMQPL